MVARRLLLVVGCFLQLLGIHRALGDEAAGPTKDLYHFVVDRSGSIGERKLVEPIRKAILDVVNTLESNTQVDLVLFNDTATAPRSWYPLDLKAKGDLDRYLTDNFKPGGETRLYDTVADVFARVKANEANY